NASASKMKPALPQGRSSAWPPPRKMLKNSLEDLGSPLMQGLLARQGSGFLAVRSELAVALPHRELRQVPVDGADVGPAEAPVDDGRAGKPGVRPRSRDVLLERDRVGLGAAADRDVVDGAGFGPAVERDVDGVGAVASVDADTLPAPDELEALAAKVDGDGVVARTAVQVELEEVAGGGRPQRAVPADVERVIARSAVHRQVKRLDAQHRGRTERAEVDVGGERVVPRPEVDGVVAHATAHVEDNAVGAGAPLD